MIRTIVRFSWFEESPWLFFDTSRFVEDARVIAFLESSRLETFLKQIYFIVLNTDKNHFLNYFRSGCMYILVYSIMIQKYIIECLEFVPNSYEMRKYKSYRLSSMDYHSGAILDILDIFDGDSQPRFPVSRKEDGQSMLLMRMQMYW